MTEICVSEDSPEAEEIARWLRAQLARQMKLSEAAIEPTRPMAYYGLDSMAGLTLVAELESYLGRAIEETVLWDHPTIESLSRHLASETAREAAGTAGER
jgi:acyl carrier protein